MALSAAWSSTIIGPPMLLRLSGRFRLTVATAPWRSTSRVS